MHTHFSRQKSTASLLSVIMLLAIVISCTSSPSSAPTAARAGPQDTALPTFDLTSSAFDEGATIPTRHTCDGEDISPELTWQGAPAGTRSFVLIMDDPDAPGRTFTHWVLFDIPAGQTTLPEGFQPGDVGTSGANDFGKTGYGGPCPPPGHGPHRYFFTLYALNTDVLNLPANASRSAVEQAMQNHLVAQARLMGRYER